MDEWQEKLKANIVLVWVMGSVATSIDIRRMHVAHTAGMLSATTFFLQYELECNVQSPLGMLQPPTKSWDTLYSAAPNSLHPPLVETENLSFIIDSIAYKKTILKAEILQK